MKEFTLFCVLTLAFCYVAGETGLWQDFKDRADVVHNYEYKSLELSKALRELKHENESLRAANETLVNENEKLKFSLSDKQRKIASIPKRNVNDLVNFDLYKWSAEKLLGVGEQSLHFKKYEKSAQYYNALIENYKYHKSINDRVLFEAGIAAFESKKHYDWSAKHFEKMLTKYPNSNYKMGAKLWLALSYFYLGDKDKFMEIFTEFRDKYRNEPEFNIIRNYYDDIYVKYNQ